MLHCFLSAFSYSEWTCDHKTTVRFSYPACGSELAILSSCLQFCHHSTVIVVAGPVIHHLGWNTPRLRTSGNISSWREGGGGRRQKGKGGWVKSREGEGGTEERGRKEDIVEGHRRERMKGREWGGEKGVRRRCKMLRGEAACQPHLWWFVRLWKWPMRLEEHEEAKPPCSLAARSSHQGGGRQATKARQAWRMVTNSSRSSVKRCKLTLSF